MKMMMILSVMTPLVAVMMVSESILSKVATTSNRGWNTLVVVLDHRQLGFDLLAVGYSAMRIWFVCFILLEITTILTWCNKLNL
jgi:hypothetical protein